MKLSHNTYSYLIIIMLIVILNIVFIWKVKIYTYDISQDIG